MKISYLGKNDGVALRIFSVEERKNPINHKYSDITLFFPGEGLFRTSENIDELIKDVNPKEYKSARVSEGPHISVHYDPDKPTIFVNRTTNIKIGCNYLGIKQDNLFAPVILRIYGNTNKPQYFAKPRHVRAGVDTGINYTSNMDTLVMLFTISRNNILLNKDIEYPANYIESDFTNFRLTVLYRYFNMPSEEMTVNLHQITPPGQSIRGLEWWEVCNLMNNLETVYTDAYFKKHPERNYRY